MHTSSKKTTNNISDNNESTAGCFLRVLFLVIILSLLFTWCERSDGKGLIDSSIEQVHHWYAHADGVWTQSDTTR